LEAELEAKGFKITRPTPEALAAMSERVAPVVKEYSETIGVDLVEQARAAMAAVAKP
jgi:TRAP-type transport system periplasmic protein